MAFLGSLFFGLPGKYSTGNLEVDFVSEKQGSDVFGNTWFGRSVQTVLGCSAVRCLTLGYLHVFIHEMGHVLAAKLCGDSYQKINILIDTCQGAATGNGSKFCCIAGPLTGMAWEIAKLTAAVACVFFLPMPIGIPLGVFLGMGSVFWLFGEIAYGFSGQGDWS